MSQQGTPNYDVRTVGTSQGRKGHVCTGCKANFVSGEAFEIANVRGRGYRKFVVNAHTSNDCREAAVRNTVQQ